MPSPSKITIYVDGVEVVLLPGMTVRHALIGAGMQSMLGDLVVRDEWGNEVGLDGAVHDGMKIETERMD